MQKFKFRHSTPAKVAKVSKASTNEGCPVANQLLKVANLTGSNNGKTETLADISKPLADQDTSKNNNLSRNSKISSTSVAIPENNNPIPPPEPPGLGPTYESLWNAAWKLADEIDNPQGAPLEQRRARLPELDKLRAEMAEIERQAMAPAPAKPSQSPPDTWHTWESSTITRDRDPDTCPAKCKRSGKCYSKVYFEGKPGKLKDCDPETCKHIITNKKGMNHGKTV